MCGIVAVVTKDKHLDASLIQRMTKIVSHRGPDDEGIWLSKERDVGLGHRRLSIIDLSPAGHQPMSTKDNSAIITFNGEVFNFKDIRASLIKKGHVFHSSSDTEVILRSYEEFGERCIHDFNGMWAFAIYNHQKKVLFASRDRVGIKPLYYYWDGNTLILASEIKAILGSGFLKPAIDFNGLNEYFTFQNIISDRTLFAKIKLLPAGHNLIYDFHENALRIEQYWDFKYDPQDLSEDEFSEIILDNFEKAMEEHLISDVEIGANISGGMDSSAITAIASKYFNKIHTFTGGFDIHNPEKEDKCFDERNDARLISKTFNTTHHEFLISADDVIATLPRIVWHLEDPKVGMCYTFYLLSQHVKNFTKVTLSGSGGDEAFAGYPWRYALIKDAINPTEFESIYYQYWNRLVKDNEKETFFTQTALLNIDLQRPREVFTALLNQASDISPINKALYFENKTFLHGMLLVEDKMSMAFSVETRVPLLDRRLVDISLKIPDSLKFRGNVSKYILKKAFERLLPQEIIHKKKQGFTPPDQTWYRRELRNYITDLLLGKQSVAQEYINPVFIKRIIREHNQGHDHRMILWSLMFFEWWCRIFLQNQTGFHELQ